MSQTTYVTLAALYVAALAVLAYIEYNRTADASDYIIAGGKLGAAVTGVSEVFSGFSGFYLIGLSGLAYLSGTWAWIALPTAGIGWILLYYGQAERLKRSTSQIGEETIPAYLGKIWNSRAILGFSALCIVVFYGVYVGSQASAGAKAIGPFFNIDYFWASVIFGAVIVLYTMSGGFMAVALSDFLQGMLVLVGSTLMVVWAVIKVGGLGILFSKLGSIDPALVSMTNGDSGTALLGGVILWFIIGLAYFGNPHVLSRFLAIDSSESVRRAMFWSAGSQIIVITMSIFIGLTARILVPNLENSELAFSMLATSVFPAWFGGIVLLSAIGIIMSTADSMLLISGTAASRDIIERFFGKDLTSTQSTWYARGAIAVIGVLGTIIAALQIDTVLWLVAFAWSTLGATFGPAILATLWWEHATKEGILVSMVSGTVVGAITYALSLGTVPEWFLAWNLWPFVASVGSLIVVSSLTESQDHQDEHIHKISTINTQTIAGNQDDD